LVGQERTQFPEASGKIGSPVTPLMVIGQQIGVAGQMAKA
jgi:hypothetical protein